MEDNTKKQKIKEVSIAIGVSVAVIACLIGLSFGMYNVFSDKIEEPIQTSAQNEEEESIDLNEESEEITEEPIEEEEEKQLEEEQAQQEENKEENLTPEEKKRREEEAKKKQEEAQKRQEELKKQREEAERKRAQAYPYWIKVNYVANTVTVYKKDENGNYTVPIKAMICSTGSSTPRSGVYRTQAKYAWKALIGSAGKYCTRITGQILFHSVPYLNGDKNKFEYWEYDRLGQTRSLGCIRLTVADALWIYNNCPLGTSVEFYGSSNPGPLGKPSAKKISGYGYPLNNWDPTDPDPNNPWHNYNAKKKAEEEAAAKKKAEEEAAAKKAAEEAAKKKAEEEARKKAEEEANKVTVPNVINMTKSQAAQNLQNFVIEYKEEIQTTGTDGVVIKQSLAAGSKVAKGTKITITIRKLQVNPDANKVEVPRVIDYSKDAATKALKDKGLNVEYKEEVQTSGTNGAVIKQNPNSGTKVAKGTKIIITIRKVQNNTNENGKEGDNKQ